MSNTAYNKIRVAGIVNDSITDGPGLRLTIFVQGCERKCPGCHNPNTWHLEGGTLYTVEELMEKVKRNPMLSGVTFSGGEPMLQARTLIPLADMIKATGLNLAIYTGYTFEELISEGNQDITKLLVLADVLIDGAFILERRSLSLSFRGSTNQRILNLKESLKQMKAVEELNPAWTG